MAGDEEGPLAGNFEQQLAAQRVAQEKLEQQLQTESQARVGMETTLSTMQQLLETLVRGQGTSSGPTTANPTATWTTTTSTDPSIYSGSAFQSNLNAAVHPNQPAMTSEETRSSSGGVPTSVSSATLFTPIPSVSLARSTAYTNVPKIVEGMSFVDFKQKVTVWRRLVSDAIPAAKQGLMLLGELPVKDKFGGLQGIIIDNIGLEVLSQPTGVDILLDFLEKRLMEPSFIRLCKWMDKFEGFEQKSSWNAERLITEFNKLINQARTEFNLTLPSVMKAAKLVRACNEIPDEQVGMITSGLDLGHSDVHKKANL